MHKMGQSGGFLGRLLGPLLKPGSSLMKNVLKPLDESVLISLGLKAAASTTGAVIFFKKINVLKEYDDMKEKIKKCKDLIVLQT